jgi:hypothetical protein
MFAIAAKSRCAGAHPMQLIRTYFRGDTSMIRNVATSVTFSLALAATISTIPQTAHADYKTSSGASCKPYGATTSDDLQYLVGGVYNRSTTAKNIICDFTVDAERPWSGVNNASLLLLFRAGDVDANVSCTGFVGSGNLADEGMLAYSDSRTIPARSNGVLGLANMTAPAPLAWVWSSFSVICTLPPRAYLFRMVLREVGAT